MDNLTQLARNILMVDENSCSLAEGYLKVIEQGLPTRGAKAKKILILGAGISGLVAASLLKRAGHQVTILEANDDRIGGRIKTFRKTDKSQPFKDPLQYAEAGAMRIPHHHPLINAYIEKLGLNHKKRPFYFVDVNKLNTSEQVFSTWLKVNGRQVRRSDYPSEDNLGFDCGDEHMGKTARDLLLGALAEPLEWTDTKKSIDEQLYGWTEVISQYGRMSLYHYLRQYGYKKDVIDYIGTIENLTSRLHLSFIQCFLVAHEINTEVEFSELEGGSWQIPYAFLEKYELAENLLMDNRVTEINWCDNGASNGPEVSVKTINSTASHTRVDREFTADYAICTIPFSGLRFVNICPDFSYGKRRALMELHYDAATKVLLEFSERFWEWDEYTWAEKIGGDYRGHNSYGGGSITDGVNRFCYFPSHAVEGSRGGVVLASYSWADDARRWDSLHSEDRYGLALKGLTDIYGKGIKRYFTGYGKTQSWMHSHFAFGESAIFSPGQLEDLHPHTFSPEGPIHFAGDHTSLKHAWIEGAVESGIRTALAIHSIGEDSCVSGADNDKVAQQYDAVSL